MVSRWGFNEILFDSEKCGRVPKGVSKLSEFSDTLHDCGFRYLNFKEDPFTWCNRRQEEEFILARLNQYVCNFYWHSLYPTVEVENLAYYGSDHRPISLILHPKSNIKLQKYQKRFTFEHAWLLEEDFLDCINQRWADSRGIISLLARLVQCSGDLKVWDGDHLVNWAVKLRSCVRNLIAS